MGYGSYRRISDSYHRKRVGTNQVLVLMPDNKYKYSNSQMYKANLMFVGPCNIVRAEE